MVESRYSVPLSRRLRLSSVRSRPRGTGKADERSATVRPSQRFVRGRAAGRVSVATEAISTGSTRHRREAALTCLGKCSSCERTLNWSGLRGAGAAETVLRRSRAGPRRFRVLTPPGTGCAGASSRPSRSPRAPSAREHGLIGQPAVGQYAARRIHPILGARLDNEHGTLAPLQVRSSNDGDRGTCTFGWTPGVEGARGMPPVRSRGRSVRAARVPLRGAARRLAVGSVAGSVPLPQAPAGRRARC